ncbi:hypothetical protein ACMFMF_003133 [Clarireedia jacksonii]
MAIVFAFEGRLFNSRSFSSLAVDRHIALRSYRNVGRPAPGTVYSSGRREELSRRCPLDYLAAELNASVPKKKRTHINATNAKTSANPLDNRFYIQNHVIIE